SILRSLELDELSRSEGRIVKHDMIYDMAGCHGLSEVHCPAYQEKFDKDVAPIISSLSAETLGTIWVLNCPWFWERLFNTVKSLRTAQVPLKIMDKIHVVHGAGTSDPVVLQRVGAEQLSELCAVQLAEDGDAKAGTVVVSESFERLVAVRPGQRVSWDFEVLPGSTFLGTADVDFHAEAIWDPSGPQQLLPGTIRRELVIQPRKVSSGDGVQKGSFDPISSGILVLTWGNSHSWFRSKSLRFSIHSCDD
ncbi:unnamed protein product, partial [Polarella glacialis]